MNFLPLDDSYVGCVENEAGLVSETERDDACNRTSLRKLSSAK